MAAAFNLTAQINLRGPTDLKPVVSKIKRELSGITTDVRINIDNKSAKSVDAVTRRLGAMNAVLIQARDNTTALNTALKGLSNALSGVQSSGSASASSINKTAAASKAAAQNIQVARTEMEVFGKQAFLAVKRFAAYTTATAGIFALTNAVTSGFKAFIQFDKELIKLQQVTGKGSLGIKALENEITRLATSLGVSSESLIAVASTLAQAGLSAEETRIALQALAKTELAPSFDNLTDTTEGAIAALRQFGLQASDLEASLGSINAVAAAFAVESRDIITAIQRTGGVFAAASKGVSEGKDALNEFIAVFTSVRATTRESAETIATGLRTIFTRIQRAKTIDQLRQFGVELQDLEGKFVGPFEAVKRLSAALNQLDPRDIRFATIVEELGGFRQIGKVIPLIQQFATAQQALGVAQKGQSSLTDAQIKAQQSLANQIAKVREQFLALIRDIGQSTVFQGFFKIVTSLASGLISLASAFKPILPILAVFATIKGVSAIGQFASGFFGGFKKGGGAGAAGQNLGQTITGSKEKERAEATSRAADAIRLNTDALKGLTSAVTSLENTIKSRGTTTLNSGGKVMGFARGGVVPGTGNRDTVPAMLMPGEFVIRKKAVEKLGTGNLHKMNKYAKGGEVFTKKIPGALAGMKQSPSIGYDDISKLKINNSGKGAIRGYFFENFINREFGVNAPENTFPDIPNLNIKKGLKEKLGLTKAQTGRDFKAAELKYRSGLKADFNSQYTQDNTAILYAIKKNNGGIIQKFAGGGKALGARSKFKELTQEEILQLSTKDLIAYGKALAQDIFSTGGAGMAVANEFIEVPPERIIPELDPYLTTYLGKRGFWREKISPFGQAVVQKVGDTSKAGRQNALQAQIAKQADEVAAREQNWTAIRAGSEIDKYLQSTLEEPILSDYKTVRGGGALSKAFHNTRLRQAVNKALEGYDDFDYSSANIGKLITNMANKRFFTGGSVSRFAVGGVAGSVGKISQDILDRIKALGGRTGIVDLAADEAAKAVEQTGIPANKLFKSNVLGAMVDGAKFAPYLEPVLKAAEAAKRNKETSARQQLENNMKAAAGGAYQFGLVSLFGPNGELGYSNISNAKELVGKNGEQFLTQIVRKSLPQRYAQAIEQVQQDIAGVPARGAAAFQYTDIFGTGNPIALDFDETLVKDADIPGKKFQDYNDLDKVQEALASAQLTLLGKELAKRLIDYPQLIESIRVLTARPQSNAPLLASKLSALGLPIPQNKITGVSGGLNKVENLSELETLIDDNLENIQAVLGAGKKGYLYSEPQSIDKNNASSRKSMAGMEGYALEEIVRSFGVAVSSDDADPNRPIDYPKGLGARASNLWGIKSTLPTDTKRKNDSSALSRMWSEAQRYFVEKFATGGQVGDSNFEKVKEEILKKYPEINFRISKRKRGFGYNILGGLKQEGDNVGNYADFQQASNLTQLAELADRMANDLQYKFGPNIDPSLLKKTQKFAEGGSAEDTVPALLTPGEFVINRKAAKRIGYAKLNKLNKADKIQGFNKGGAVGGIQRFFRGGVADKDVVRGQGTVLSDVKQAEKTLAIIMGQLGKNIRESILKPFKGIEDVAAGQDQKLVPTGQAFTENTRGRAAINLKTQATSMGLQIGGGKTKATTETVAHEAGHLADYSLGGKTGKFASDTEGTFQFALIEKVKPVMEKAFQKAGMDASRIAKYLGTNKELFAEFFAKASPQVRAIITSTTDAAVGMQALADHLGDTAYTFAGLEASDIIDPWESIKNSVSSLPKPPVGPPSSPPSGPSGGGGGGGGPPSGPSDLPVVNTKLGEERAAYTKYRAEQAGMSVGGYKYSMAQKLGKNQYDVEREMKFAQTETKNIAAGRSRELKGIDIEAATKEGATTEEAKKVQSIIGEFAAGLQKANPALGAAEARDAAIALAKGLSDGTKSVEQIVAANDTLNNTLNSSVDANKVMEEAFRRTAAEMGESVENLNANVSQNQIKQQAFIQSEAGQRFGKLAEFAPGLTEKFSKTKAGGRLAQASDFVSGKGGRFSKAFASVGGITGIGAGVATGVEALKTSGLISKKTLKNENVAGLMGGLGGAATGAAAGYEMLGGGIPGLIGAGVGATIGGVKGFFDAKNAQALNNALEKLATSSEGVDKAFKKLAENDTDKNFKNVQEAFGTQIKASKQLENIALGGGGEGPSVMGTGGSALFGAGVGAAIGTAILPGIGSAIGAAIGAGLGGITGFIAESQSKANREEALRGRIGSAGAMNDAAVRMAERQTGRMSTEELGKQQQAGINVLADQYRQSAIAAAEAANGTKDLTTKQKQKISQNAEETAYLDAYMKMRKEAGATDEKISEDILADRKLALQAGKEALDAQNQAFMKQQMLARATKEVALATENLLDVYRRVGANAQRFSDEIGDMLAKTQNIVDSLGGKAAVPKVDRTGAERVLGNMAAYSSDEVRAATQEMVGKLGGGEEAQALGKQAEAAKFLQDKLPALLRQPNADAGEIMDSLRDEMSTMGLGGDAINKMLDEIEVQISKGQEGGLGTLADEIATGGIDKLSATADQAAKTLQNLAKTYNDALQQSIDLQNQYNEVIMQSNAYMRKAGTIRINAELDLARALGNSPTLQQLNEPFDFEIKDLTKGLVPGGTTDPTAIANGIMAATAQNQQLAEANANLGNSGMQGVTSPDGGAQLLAEQQKNIAAMGANSIAINEGREALEKLANDGTKAANALAKIEEQQRQIESMAGRLEKIFTASPEELFKMQQQSDALALAQTAGPEQFKSRRFRQDAFAGLEQDKEFLSTEEYRKQRGMLLRKSLEAQGYTGQSMINKGGIEMTVDDFIKRVEGGVSEEDPNVKAYREAVATQIQANKELARLNELQALAIQDSMLGLQDFLATEFPKILTDAVTASKTDAETKPQTKTESKRTEAEKTKAEADKRASDAEKKEKQIDSQIAKEKSALKKAEESWMGGPGRSVEIAQRKNKIKELEKQKAEQQAIKTESQGVSATASNTIAEEKKQAEATKAEQVKAEQKAKDEKVAASMQQSQQAGGGTTATTTQPPTRAEVRASIQQRQTQLMAAGAQPADATNQNATQTPQQTASTSQQTYGATRAVTAQTTPQVTAPTSAEARERMALNLKGKARRTPAEEKRYQQLRQQQYAANPALKAKAEARERMALNLKGKLREGENGLPIGRTPAEEQRYQALVLQQKPDPLTPEQRKSWKQIAKRHEQAGGGAVGGVGNIPYSGDGRTAQDSNALRLPTTTAPVPVTKPQNVAYTAQTLPNGQQPTPTETNPAGNVFTIDQSSLDGLSTFNTNFATYVDKLVGFAFPTIPENIQMTGNHVVDVRVTGAAAFEALQEGVKKMINTAIDTKMGEIWQQTGGQLGKRPGTPAPKQ